MRHALRFLLLGCGWLALACYWSGYCWLLLWPAASYLTISAGYALLGAGVFGKHLDGTMSPVAFVLMLPYVAGSWLIWAVTRLVSSEPPCSEVSEGLWIGRRPLARELPHEVGLVVDLTCELWEPREIRGRRDYLCVPTLDQCLPLDHVLANIVRRVARERGMVLIHCAQGHNRSAAVAAAVMVVRGLAPDAEEASRRIAAVRPKIHIRRVQLAAVNRVLSSRAVLRPAAASAGE